MNEFESVLILISGLGGLTLFLTLGLSYLNKRDDMKNETITEFGEKCQ